MSKLRPFGQLTEDLENLLAEAVDEQGHDLQLGEVLAWVKNYIEVHYPGAIEEYEDGTRPEYYYGPSRTEPKDIVDSPKGMAQMFQEAQKYELIYDWESTFINKKRKATE